MQQPPALRLGGAVLTNPAKVFWPEEGFTKRDVALFYRRLARLVLPWMRDRAITMERCPEGLRKACFFQKQAPSNLPAEVPTLRIPAPSAGRDVDYIIGGSLKTLLVLVNLGAISIHVGNSRTDRLDSPDWMAFDLDPARGFCDAVEVALLLKAQLEDRGLESFVKTSGGRGLHVCVPLRRGATQERVRAYAAGVAGELATAKPKLVTLESRTARRRAPVYLDITRNAGGQTLVSPYSVRWLPHAPVSMPLAWNEVNSRLDPRAFNLKTAERRAATRTPWSDFFRKRQTLPRS
jgi:bifunctional non-homologous end joining protein LigD